MTKIGLIVLNWNNYYDTKECINSILKYKISNELDIKVYLIDNNSGDGSGEQLSLEFNDRVAYFNTGQNLGYTGGNNFGIKKAFHDSCEFVLVLNNDLVIEDFDNLLYKMIDIFKFDSSIAIVGFVLRDEHILNSVANPTKLVEYMWCGIIPIVKYEDLGDYSDLGYEYIKYDNITSNMRQKKSFKNSEIIKNISNNKFSMKAIIDV